MKTIVIYTSQTGFTKRYAEWISEASGAECLEFKQAKKIKLSDYDAMYCSPYGPSFAVRPVITIKKSALQ